LSALGFPVSASPITYARFFGSTISGKSHPHRQTFVGGTASFAAVWVMSVMGLV
jgi:hypothetical protein